MKNSVTYMFVKYEIQNLLISLGRQFALMEKVCVTRKL